MDVECPICHISWDWIPPEDVTGIRKGPSENPARIYSVTCPNKHELEIEF
jgi:hypothetical protein